MKTKKQEQEALNKIKEILSDFGPDTYLGIAFDSVLEDAQTNIDNDWGCSWRKRYEKAVKDNMDLTKKLDDAIDSKKQAQATSLPSDIMSDILCSSFEYQNVLKEKVAETERTIIELAEDAGSKEFVIAVRQRKLYLEKYQREEAIIDTVNKAYSQKQEG